MFNEEKRYENFESGNGYYLANAPRSTSAKLPPGVYELVLDQKTQQIYFKKTRNMHDDLIDLPSDAYHQVVSEIENFIKPETRAKFVKRGCLYKRSALLHGRPGTGKTCIANRLCKTVVGIGGVVLQNPDPRLLPMAFDQLEHIQPETLTMVVFEELDKLASRYEEHLLNLLDGEIQKENIVYIATTNYINKVPVRLKRPGRFSSVIEVEFPKAPEREHFLRHKAPDMSPETLTEWVSKTEGLSIDEVTECVRSVMCLGYPLEDIVKRFITNVDHGSSDLEEAQEEGEELNDAIETIYRLSQKRNE